MRARSSWQALFLAGSVTALAVFGCASKERRPAPSGGGSGAPAHAEGGDATGGEASPTSGASAVGEGGGGADGSGGAIGSASSVGGAGGKGDATSGGEPSVFVPDKPFTGPDPFPCDSDVEAVADELEADCAPNGTWGPEHDVASPAGSDSSLVGITPDELTLAWAEAHGSEVSYFVAERSTLNESFGSLQEVDGVSVLGVSADGLRLAALSPDQSALVVLTRPNRASDFGAPAEGEFAALDADAREHGWSFSSCVFAPGDRTLFYTAGAADSKYLLRVAQRTDDGPWGVGTLLEQCELEVHGGYGRYPTGVSADGQTLFFFDSWRGLTRSAWRDPKTSAFTWFKDVGEWMAAQPNTACDRLYFSRPGSDSAVSSAPAQ